MTKETFIQLIESHGYTFSYSAPDYDHDHYQHVESGNKIGIIGGGDGELIHAAYGYPCTLVSWSLTLPDAMIRNLTEAFSTNYETAEA